MLEAQTRHNADALMCSLGWWWGWGHGARFQSLLSTALRRCAHEEAAQLSGADAHVGHRRTLTVSELERS